MWLNMLVVKLYYVFLVYMVDGGVMVIFIPKQSKNAFVLLEINCKMNSRGGAIIPYFVHK